MHSGPVTQTIQLMISYGIVGFNVPLDTMYRSFWGQFYASYDPTNSVIALKDNGYSTRSRANPTRLKVKFKK